MSAQTLSKLQYQGKVYTLVHGKKGPAGAKKPKGPTGTKKELQALEKFLVGAEKAFARVTRENSVAAKLHATALKKTTSKSKAEDYWLENAMKQKAIANFVNSVNVAGDLEAELLKRIRAVMFGGKRTTAWNTLRTKLQSAYISAQREEARKPAYAAGIPKEVVKKFFPPSYVFDVAPDGRLVREFEVFGNAEKTIEKKRKAMSFLLSKWNELADVLTRDLQSSDPMLRLTALVTSIIVNTGIRPSEGGESDKKDPFGKTVFDDEGKPVRVKTFGAAGIKPEHVEFVRDNFAVLQFTGKSGTKNIAELTDPTLVKLLQQQVAAATGNTAGPVFVAPNGNKVTPKRINGYLHRILGPDVTATDFRKLKATQTFYSTLKLRRHELATELKQLKNTATDDMRTKVVALLVKHLTDAVEDAQDAISHGNFAVTVQYYISPRVILEYLSGKGINRALDVTLGNGKELQIAFDPADFFETVTKTLKEKAASVQHTASTMFYFGDDFVDYNVDDVIEELEEGTKV